MSSVVGWLLKAVLVAIGTLAGNPVVAEFNDLGLSASCLVASGFDEGDVPRLVERLRADSPERAAWVTARQEESEARRALVQLKKLHPGADGSELDTDDADQLWRDKSNALRSTRDHLRTLVLKDEDPVKIVKINAWDACRWPALPSEFRVSSWSDEEARQLIDDLAQEKRADQQDAGVSDEVAQRLATARSRPEVASAITWLAARLTACRTALNNAASSQ